MVPILILNHHARTVKQHYCNGKSEFDHRECRGRWGRYQCACRSIIIVSELNMGDSACRFSIPWALNESTSLSSVQRRRCRSPWRSSSTSSRRSAERLPRCFAGTSASLSTSGRNPRRRRRPEAAYVFRLGNGAIRTLLSESFLRLPSACPPIPGRFAVASGFHERFKTTPFYRPSECRGFARYSSICRAQSIQSEQWEKGQSGAREPDF